MRTSAILCAVLAGGALATPVRKYLEERAIVVDWVTTTTVVWVTEGQTVPTPAAAPQKAAVAPSPHHAHKHAHAYSAPQSPTSTTPTPTPSPTSTSVVSVQQPAETPKTTSTSVAAPPASSQPAPSAGSGSGSANAPTGYVDNLDTTSDTYKALVLQHHNIHRANHSADDLVWDDTLASYAEQTAKTCVWGHSLAPGGGGYGQNIAAGTPASHIANILTNGFYNDEMMLFPGYGNDSPDMSNFEKWGHYSQMLWQSTQKVGCYTYTCSPPGADPLNCNSATGQSYLKNSGCGNGGMEAIFTVCNYSPPGNYANQYSKVGKPLGKGFVYAGEDGVHGL